MQRQIIKIDEAKCTGCGLCVTNCAEGALKIINGKARLVSDVYCDGLGACLGHCPEGALEIIERDAPAFDEAEVTKYLGHAPVQHAAPAHAAPAPKKDEARIPCGCPSANFMNLAAEKQSQNAQPFAGDIASELAYWPVQLHLINPMNPQFSGRDFLVAADCVAYTLGDFHPRWLKGKALAIACPKLDEGLEVYRDKIVALIDEAQINTLTVMTMEVPCCGGLLRLVKEAVSAAKRKVPVKAVCVGIRGGNILSEEWL